MIGIVLRMRTGWVWGFPLILCMASYSAVGQEKQEPAASEIPQTVLQDPLLEKMVGKWDLTGRFEGQPVHHSVEVTWVLNHQFLRIHEKDLSPQKAGAVPYEATVFVGYDGSKKQYVAHWIDVFGSGAPVLGHGKLEGSAIEFLFDYPGQPWLTTFRWRPEAGNWQWLMQSKDREEKWTQTADMVLVPGKAK